MMSLGHQQLWEPS
ncbi:hypothetical protein CP061683_1110, partial [Chlamydia psittaci 06-1683]